MRDAHQSLLATRFRTFDIAAAAPSLCRAACRSSSRSNAGAAPPSTSRCASSSEDPWERLALIREKVPNILTQMLLRGANGVGYTNYPDNVVQHFVAPARRRRASTCSASSIASTGSRTCAWRSTRSAQTGKLVEGAICYTGDILDPASAEIRSRTTMSAIAKELESAGCHILGIKDMAGLLKPAAARVLVRALKEEIGLPIHFHTHDTSGISAATVLAAVEAGVDAVDAAMDAMSGNTSQPCLGSIVEALRAAPRDSGLDSEAIRQLSFYWEAVRTQYAAFESDLKAPASEVYLHEMPGGQFTNLREQARAFGLEARWHEVAKAYRAANDLFGDIVKVTPSSKVVGDLALMMVSQNLSPADVLDPANEIAFPSSVIEMLRGDLGQPPGGWPSAVAKEGAEGRHADHGAARLPAAARRS